MRGRALAFVLAGLFPLLLYARSIGFDYVRADDADLIGANQAFLADLRNVPRAFTRSYFEIEGQRSNQSTYYRPVTIASFMVDAARAGNNPHAYHTTNVVLHAVVTCLLLALAIRWGASLWTALAAALLFAVHPINVQAVAWIAGRNDLLAALFGLLSVWSFAALKGCATGKTFAGLKACATSSVGQPFRAAGHVLAFALALFSKETGLLFPVVAVLHQRLVARERLTRPQVIALGGDSIIVVEWLVLRARALGGIGSDLPADTLHATISNLPQLLMHAGKMLVPLRLNVSPGVEPVDLLLGASAALLFAFVAMRWMRRGIAMLAVCWFLLFLLPTLVVPGLPVYEHRAYVPLVGLLTLMAVGLGPLTRRAAVLVIAIVVAFATLTYQRLEVFSDPLTYWTDGTRDAQFGPLAHVNLGQLHEADGRLADARREYAVALVRNPNTPKAHNNLGVVFMAVGEPERARDHFREETERHPSNPEAWFNLGLWNELKGDNAAARRFYERAIAADSSYQPAYDKLGLVAPR